MADLDASRNVPQIDWEAFYANYRKPDYVRGYEILQKLGAGAFGIVFKARKHSIGKDYAIKFLKVDDAGVRDAVLHELDTVRLFAQIDHPNLVSIEDMGHVDGIPYIVMGYAGDETLARMLQAGPLPRDEALRIFVQVCRGVQALHERMLVHFDLKPANVYRKGDTARVGDYGLSKLVTASRRSLSFGRGTTYYMAPEVLQRKGDHRSDIYSLGVMLYECLVGRVPFQGETEWEILKKHETETPSFPAHLAPTDRAVLEACLQKNPDRRPQSIGAVLALLHGGSIGEAARPGHAPTVVLPAPAVAAGRGARRQRQRGWRVVGVMVLLFVIVQMFRPITTVEPEIATANGSEGTRAIPRPRPPRAPRTLVADANGLRRGLPEDLDPQIAELAATAARVRRNLGKAERDAAAAAAAQAEAEVAQFHSQIDAAISALQRLREVDVRRPEVRDKAVEALGVTLRRLDLKNFGQDPWTEAMLRAVKAGLEHEDVRAKWAEVMRSLVAPADPHRRTR